jgi:hypothetical protein
MHEEGKEVQKENAGNWWQRHRPDNATLVAATGLIAAITSLIGILQGCGPS